MLTGPKMIEPELFRHHAEIDKIPVDGLHRPAPRPRVAEHHECAEFHDWPSFFVYLVVSQHEFAVSLRGAARRSNLVDLAFPHGDCFALLATTAPHFHREARASPRGLGNPLGLKHLVRIRPHAGELPLTDRL